MQNITLKNVRTIKLNSFRPLCKNIIGQRAVAEDDKALPPFIDGSCRREPDFESTYPSISALCRREIFAPHLRKGDVVVYITTKGVYPNEFTKEAHHRLIAILQVKEVFKTHQLAANWFLDKGLPIPSNCMVDGNLPKPFDETAGKYEKKKDMVNFLAKTPELKKKIGDGIIKFWNQEYQEVADRLGCFIVCEEPIFLELNNPPIILEHDWLKALSKPPYTRTPSKMNTTQLKNLAVLAGINLTI